MFIPIAASLLLIVVSLPVDAVRLRNSNKVKQSGCMLGGVCPSGPYAGSCVDCSTDSNGVLTCSCMDSGGNYQPASLPNSFSCASNIYNSGGYLECVLPPGNYIETCQSCGIIYGNALLCICQNEDNVFAKTVLGSISTCTYVQNIDGALTCQGSTPEPTDQPSNPTPNPTPKPTSGGQQCIWSSTIIASGGVESSPTSACSTKTALQGCEYNNFCCFNTATATCGPVPGCPNCQAITSSGNCGSAPSGCCYWNSNDNLCERTCPYGNENVSVCPT